MTKPTKPKVREFDVANYLETPADIAAYLTVAAEDEEGNPEELIEAFRYLVEVRPELKEVADLSENGTPSLEAIIYLMRKFGLRIHFEAI